MLIWYHGIARGPLLSIQTKTVQTFVVWRHNGVKIADFAQFTDFEWNIGQNGISQEKI